MTVTVVDLTARRRDGEAAVVRIAAAPVRHVPDVFLAALLCVDVTQLPAGPSRLLPRAR